LILALSILAEFAQAGPLDTWTSSSPLPQIGLSAIAYAQGQFVAAGWPKGAILTSAGGVNWIQRQSNIQAGRDGELYGIASGNGLFVAVGGYFQQGAPPYVAILSSSDGMNWTQGKSGTEGSLNNVTYGNGRFVAVGASSILTSADGVNWIEGHTGAGNCFGIAYGSGRFVAVGTTGEPGPTKPDVISFPIILTSADGLNWMSHVLKMQPYTGLNAVAYGDGQFVAVGAGLSPDLEEAPTPIILTSTDGNNWVECHSTANLGLHAVTYASGQFVVVGRSGGILTSPNGRTWVQRPSPTKDALTGIAYGNGHFVAVGPTPTILESGCIINLAMARNIDKGLLALALSLEGPIGLNYTLQSSTNLISWRNLTNITATQPTNIIFDRLSPAAEHVFYRAYSE
jgi:hypothetical protein